MDYSKKGLAPRPRVGRQARITPAAQIKAFQSTPPHGGRRHVPIDVGVCTWVSIHAPACGATIVWPTIALRPAVSIHAPALGAT
jgi:hypothetical protein